MEIRFQSTTLPTLFPIHQPGPDGLAAYRWLRNSEFPDAA